MLRNDSGVHAEYKCAGERLPNRAEAEGGLQPNAQFNNVCCSASKVDKLLAL